MYLEQKFLAAGRAEETVLKKEDLVKAETLCCGNSVRALFRAEITDR